MQQVVIDPQGYYATLEVGVSATAEDIKSAYRRLARKYHPDVNKEATAEANFKKVQEAYETLSDESKRKAYDNPRPSNPFADIFSGFETWLRRPAPKTGEDQVIEIDITLEEACQGAVRDIDLPSNEVCSGCSGDMCKPGKARQVCDTCKGVGSVSHTRRINNMVMSTAAPCGSCHGVGYSIPTEDKCDKCQGSGLIPTIRRVVISIPPGVSPNMRMIRKNEGLLTDPKGSRGAVVLAIKFRPHEIFFFSNEGLAVDIPITFTEAAMGCSIECPTLHGKETIEVPPGVENGKVFYLKGAGLVIGGQKQPLLARIVYAIPHLDLKKDEDVLSSLKKHETKKSAYMKKHFSQKEKVEAYLRKGANNDGKENGSK